MATSQSTKPSWDLPSEHTVHWKLLTKRFRTPLLLGKFPSNVFHIIAGQKSKKSPKVI